MIYFISLDYHKIVQIACVLKIAKCCQFHRHEKISKLLYCLHTMETSGFMGIEDYPAASCRPASGGIPRKEFNQSIIRSLTPQQAAGNALAIAVQYRQQDA